MHSQLLALTSLTATASGKAGDWKPLLDAKFSQFDVYLSYRGDQIMSVLQGKAPAGLKPVGLNPAGTERVHHDSSRTASRCCASAAKSTAARRPRQEFSNYHFRASFKWGEKKWEPRLTELKDSGILYHSRGAFGVDYWKSWALSQEFQVIEHGIGEYWRIASSEIDIRADPKAPGAVAPKWNPKAPWMEFSGSNNNALAGSDEDRPGEWNTLELVCFQDRCVHIANGRVVMALRNARYQEGETSVPMTGGKLQIQSEAAEVFYRDVEIRAIAAMPQEHEQFFRN